MSMNTRDTFEHEVKRRAHKISVRANCGDLVGPDLEAALLDLIWWTLKHNEQRGNVLEVA